MLTQLPQTERGLNQRKSSLPAAKGGKELEVVRIVKRKGKQRKVKNSLRVKDMPYAKPILAAPLRTLKPEKVQLKEQDSSYFNFNFVKLPKLVMREQPSLQKSQM